MKAASPAQIAKELGAKSGVARKVAVSKLSWYGVTLLALTDCR
jgi:hypothetical protein